MIAYEYNISACCISQNESRFIKEWIDYHRLIGVEHFYVYDNISDDNTYAILEPYIKKGIVEYIYWDRTYNTEKEWWHVQRDAYIDAVERAKNHSKWLAIIDTDEFIVPIKDHDLKSFLDDFDEFGGVCISWIFYGSSGIQTLRKNHWMVTQLVHRSELSYHLNKIGKSIVRPERVDAQKSFFPHTCAYKNNYYHVNAEKKRLKKSVVRDFCSDRIRLHHYWARDLDFLYEQKLPRYARWIGEERAIEKVKIEEQMNECFDPIIVNVIKRLKKRS
ncbi:MAG: glycosyltransferase family 92 protein [Simkaniaceae bacterium]|nr:glycosyltransferase family 92 protein [Simkaniaceae bacterium]